MFLNKENKHNSTQGNMNDESYVSKHIYPSFQKNVLMLHPWKVIFATLNGSRYDRYVGPMVFLIYSHHVIDDLQQYLGR